MLRGGADVVQSDRAATYRPAIERYIGNLYSVDPGFAVKIRRTLHEENRRHILILSALYGPLHPLSPIQDYNLKMSNSPAYRTRKAGLASFLKEYVTRNGIRSVCFYLGRTI